MSIFDECSNIDLFDDGSINSHAIRAVLAEKGLNYHRHRVKEVPAALRDVNPVGELPMINVRHDVKLFDPVLICDYLNDRYPEPSIYPSAAGEKATVKLMLWRLQRFFLPAIECIDRGGRTAPEARRELHAALIELASMCPSRGYLISEHVSVLDCFFGAMLHHLHKSGFKMKDKELKPLQLYLARLYNRTQFKLSLD
jgi:RNA polymerase-associated protein